METGFELTTARLRLRPTGPGDLGVVLRLQTDPELQRHFHDGSVRTPEECAAGLEQGVECWRQGFGSFVVELPDGELVGTVGFNVPEWLPEVMPAHDVGWTIVQEHQHRGYATEAARAVIDWYFVTAAVGDRIVAIHNSSNPRSGQVMDRLGMRWIAHLRHPDLGYGLEVRELTAADWLSS